MRAKPHNAGDAAGAFTVYTLTRALLTLGILAKRFVAHKATQRSRSALLMSAGRPVSSRHCENGCK